MKLMVLDGNSIINRAYYGIRPLTNREGLYTHAVFGFLTTLLRLKEEEQPDALCVTSGGVKVGEVDPNYGGYASPVENPIQGNVMMISDEAPLPSDTPVEKSEARYTVKGLLGKQVLYTARQEGRVLTLDAPDDNATFRTTIQDMKTLMNQGVSTLVLTTEKGSTTLNLSLLCEGQTDTQRVVLRQLGDSAFLTVGLRCRRDLIVGR